MSKQKLFRMIVPAYPELNIYSYSKNAQIVSGGAVAVATSVDRMPGWYAEVIDENSYFGGPKTKDGLPDHEALQRKRHADAVGFYCGMSCTIERVWFLAKLYQQAGAKTIAGGLHASSCPQETLGHNIDVVVRGSGEHAIKGVLNSLFDGFPMGILDGVSFLSDGRIVSNPPKPLTCEDLNRLRFADFGLVRFSRPMRSRVFPISRIRGCGMNCEYCSVNWAPVWASAEHAFEHTRWLVETWGAKKFFIVDDRMEQDMEGSVKFFTMIKQEYGNKLEFYVQTRLGIAVNTAFLELMRAAGVRTLFVGCESPIDEDLKSMNKGYTARNMIKWVRILRCYFWVHGMFIFGYPPRKKEAGLSAREMYQRFRKFIFGMFGPRFDSIQVLKTIPLVGTKLRQRLEAEGRVLPLSLVPWSKYDGNSICFIPDNMSVDDMQKYPMKLMRAFYSPTRIIWVVLRLALFPVDYLSRGWAIGFKMGWLARWKEWHRKWFGAWHTGWYKDVIKCVGHFILAKWERKHRESGILEKIKRYCAGKKISGE